MIGFGSKPARTRRLRTEAIAPLGQHAPAALEIPIPDDLSHSLLGYQVLDVSRICKSTSPSRVLEAYGARVLRIAWEGERPPSHMLSVLSRVASNTDVLIIHERYQHLEVFQELVSGIDQRVACVMIIAEAEGDESSIQDYRRADHDFGLYASGLILASIFAKVSTGKCAVARLALGTSGTADLRANDGERTYSGPTEQRGSLDLLKE